MNGNIFELVFVFFMLPGAEGLQVLRSRALPQSHLPVKSCAHPQLSRLPIPRPGVPLVTCFTNATASVR